MVGLGAVPLLLLLALPSLCAALPQGLRQLQKHGPPTEKDAASIGLGAPIDTAAPAAEQQASLSPPQVQAAPAAGVLAPDAGMVMTVVVPAGMAPGQAMVVTGTDGTRVQVVIPDGVGPGQSLQVQVPPPAPLPVIAAPVAAVVQQAPVTPLPAMLAATPAASTAPAEEQTGEGPQPVPFTTQTTADLPQHTVTIHGTPIKFVVTAQAHVGLILGHVKRELHGYAIMRDAIETAKARREGTPLVVDVGANHGLYALYAAALGATVIAVEPQRSLCEVIRLAASLNGEEIAGRITLYNNAVLEKPEMVAMSKSEVAEGAVAHVDRSAGAGSVQALPIATLAPPTLGRISFLKIDVEGFELLAVPSAYPLFASQRVDHTLIEFGPPSRWNGAGKSEADGLAMLTQLADPAWALDTRLVQSYAYNDVIRAAAASDESIGGFLEAMRTKQTKGTYLSLADSTLWPALMSGMKACEYCEAQLWLAHLTPGVVESYPTFGDLLPCVRDGAGDSVGKHRKPCFIRDLGDGLQTRSEGEEHGGHGLR